MASEELPRVYHLSWQSQNKRYGAVQAHVLQIRHEQVGVRYSGFVRPDQDAPARLATQHGLGHSRDAWERPDMQAMWLEMVRWSMGLAPGDATPRPLP